jgi:hypothetical protein
LKWSISSDPAGPRKKSRGASGSIRRAFSLNSFYSLAGVAGIFQKKGAENSPDRNGPILRRMLGTFGRSGGRSDFGYFRTKAPTDGRRARPSPTPTNPVGMPYHPNTSTIVPFSPTFTKVGEPRRLRRSAPESCERERSPPCLRKAQRDRESPPHCPPLYRGHSKTGPPDPCHPMAIEQKLEDPAGNHTIRAAMLDFDNKDVSSHPGVRQGQKGSMSSAQASGRRWVP